MGAEIELTPKHVVHLRDFLAGQMQGYDIGLMADRKRPDEAREYAERMSLAIEAMDIVGWPGEGNHPIILHGEEQKNVIRRATEAMLSKAEEIIEDAKVEDAQVDAELSGSLLAAMA